MSRLRIFDETDSAKPVIDVRARDLIAHELASIGVGFEQWQAMHAVAVGDPPEAIMAAYRADIDRISAERGFKSVDVVSIYPDHPQRSEMRTKFLDEHFHKEDEVRFFVAGSGLFTLHVGARVYEITCVKDDLISIPDSTPHWFDMGPEPSFVAIRFFTEADGWIGHFTGTDIAQRFPRFEVKPGESS